MTGMDDLGDLAGAIEEVHAPDGGATAARVTGDRRLAMRRRAVMGFAALVVLLVPAMLLIGTRTNTEGGLSTLGTAATAPQGTTPGTALPSLGQPILQLAPEALRAQPVIPSGWQAVSYGLGQLAVPPEWAPIRLGGGSACEGGPPTSPAYVVLGGGTFGVGHSCAPAPSRLVLTVSTQAGAATRQVNGLGVSEVLRDCSLPCDEFGVPDLELTIAAFGIPSDTVRQILGTITLSSVARVLADGPTTNTSAWSQRAGDGLSFLTPTTWKNRVLGSADTSPGLCSGGAAMFSSSPDQTLTGIGGMAPSCPMPELRPRPPVPADGVWIPPGSDCPQDESAHDTPLISVDSNRVAVRNPAVQDSVTLTVALTGSCTTISVGIGTDDSIARTILQSLRADGRPLRSDRSINPGTTAAPGTTVPPSSTAAEPPHSTGADIATVGGDVRIRASGPTSPEPLVENAPCSGTGTAAYLHEGNRVSLVADDHTELSSATLPAGKGYLANLDPANPTATLDMTRPGHPTPIVEMQCGFRFQLRFNKKLQRYDHYTITIGSQPMGTWTYDQLLANPMIGITAP